MFTLSNNLRIECLKEIAEEQYYRIKDSLPVQRGNVSLSNLQSLNTILYMAEQGCKWRGLPKRCCRWHTIYMRMNRWTKNGTLDACLSNCNWSRSCGSRSKHSRSTHSGESSSRRNRRFKKTDHRPLEIPQRMEHKDSFHMVAADARTAIVFALSPGHDYDVPHGRALLEGLGPMPEGLPLLMDRAYEGNEIRPTGTRPGHDPGDSVAVQPLASTGLGSRDLQKAQRHRTPVPQTQRLPPDLLTL